MDLNSKQTVFQVKQQVFQISESGGYKSGSPLYERPLEKADLPERLDVVSTVGSTGEIRQVELNLIPAFVKSHGHGADERLDTSGRLVVGGSETTTHVLVIQDLHFEGKVLLQLFSSQGKGTSGSASVQDHAKLSLLTFLMIMTRKGSLIARVFF